MTQPAGGVAGGSGTAHGGGSLSQALTGVLQAIRDNTDRLQRNVEEKLDDFRHELLEKQEAACDQLSKKIKSGKAYEFRERGAVQVQRRPPRQNRRCDRRPIEKASDRDRPEAVERAKKTLAEGKDLLRGRQKLIKIADRAEQGWKAAEEYEKDPVTSDSDDEKRIRKAEISAERKANKHFVAEGDLRSALAALIGSEAGSVDSPQELEGSTPQPGSQAEEGRTSRPLDVDLVLHLSTVQKYITWHCTAVHLIVRGAQ